MAGFSSNQRFVHLEMIWTTSKKKSDLGWIQNIFIYDHFHTALDMSHRISVADREVKIPAIAEDYVQRCFSTMYQVGMSCLSHCFPQFTGLVNAEGVLLTMAQQSLMPMDICLSKNSSTRLFM